MRPEAWSPYCPLVVPHNAGPVWLDDSDHVEDDRFWELIRGTTGDATFAKKGEDRSTNVTERLTAAVVVSGEGLNVRGQKANEERCVLLTPEDPTDRVDLRNPLRPQWESITEFRAANPDLTSSPPPSCRQRCRRQWRRGSSSRHARAAAAAPSWSTSTSTPSIGRNQTRPKPHGMRTRSLGRACLAGASP